MGILFSVWPRPSPSPPHEGRSCIRSVGECVGRTQFLPPQYVMDIDLQTPGSGRWPIRAQLSHQLTNQRTALTSADTADQSQPSLSHQLIQLTNNSSEVGRVWDNEFLNLPSLCAICATATALHTLDALCLGHGNMGYFVFQGRDSSVPCLEIAANITFIH